MYIAVGFSLGCLTKSWTRYLRLNIYWRFAVAHTYRHLKTDLFLNVIEGRNMGFGDIIHDTSLLGGIYHSDTEIAIHPVHPVASSTSSWCYPPDPGHLPIRCEPLHWWEKE